MAVVETDGEEGHAAARRAYEKAGYTGFPIVRYFKDLLLARLASLSGRQCSHRRARGE